jgi:hypothetical protein
MLVLLMAAMACVPDQEIRSLNDPPPVIPTAADLSGRVCDPTGYTWLEGAQVYANLFDEDGAVMDVRMTTTDAEGYWTLLDVPAHYTVNVYVQKGSTIIEEHSLDLVADRLNEIEPPACLDPSTLDIIVVSGNYDDFDRVLEKMGINDYASIDGRDLNELLSFLSSPSDMAEYDLIFFNGGFVEDGVIYDLENPGNPEVAAVRANIKDFVVNGGDIYASDWAYDVVSLVWPGKVDFVGADATPDAAQKGTSQVVNAAVNNSALAEFMEMESPYTPIVYDLPVWPPVVASSATVSNHLVANVEYREGDLIQNVTNSPLLFSFNGGGGRVVYSSFRLVSNDDDDLIKVMKYVMFAL